MSFKSTTLVEMILCCPNSILSSIRKKYQKYLLFLFLSAPLSCNVIIYPIILDNIESNGFITSSKYSIKYLELLFIPTNFSMIVFSTCTLQIFIGFWHHKMLLSYQVSTLYFQKLLLQIFLT